MKNHAVRKFEVAKAMGSFSGQKRKTKSGVKGKGRYKTWTVQGMLRATLLVGQVRFKLCVCICKAFYVVVIFHFGLHF